MGYSLHVAVALLFMLMSVRCTRALMVVMTLSGSLWPLTAVLNFPIWGEDDLKPGSFFWWGTFIKWLIVNFLACVPVLWLKQLDRPTPRQIRLTGIFVYVILGSNVVWTVGYIKNQVVDWVNHIIAFFLTLSLALHCCALSRHSKTCKRLFELKRGLVFGYGTPYPWLMCYTVWNILFVAEISIGMTLQDILFWALMIGYRTMDTKREPIEMYFAFARPVQLGTYIALSDWVGTVLPVLRNANTLKKEQPLPVNSNSFIFFIVLGNLIWSILCTWWAAKRLIWGFDPDNLGDRKYLRDGDDDTADDSEEDSDEDNDDVEE